MVWQEKIEGRSRKSTVERRYPPKMTVEAAMIDAIDRRILGELQEDARLSMAELGRRISLSPPAVADRVQRLERTGVITGYRAEVEPKALGFPLAAVVRVRPASRQLHKIPEIARTTWRRSSTDS
jgi:Lrp/AsnC family transcriptional regulator, leucine-responsive regulatory protein